MTWLFFGHNQSWQAGAVVTPALPRICGARITAEADQQQRLEFSLLPRSRELSALELDVSSLSWNRGMLLDICGMVEKVAAAGTTESHRSVVSTTVPVWLCYFHPQNPRCTRCMHRDQALMMCRAAD